MAKKKRKKRSASERSASERQASATPKTPSSAASEPPASSTGGERTSPPPGPAGDSTRQRMLARLAVAVAAALAFGRSLSQPLVPSWDDGRFIIDNPIVREISFAHLGSILTQPHFQAFHPLHLLSYWIDVPWFGVDGPALHVTSLVLWIGALLLLLEASWALGFGLFGGAATALIVGVHPAQVEAVVWATGRKDILALGFCALAVLLHLKSQRRFDRFAYAALLAYGAACLSKTTALPLPLMLLAADVLLRGRGLRESLIRQAPALLIAAVLGSVTVGIWSDAAMIREEASFGERVNLVFATLSHHLSSAFWPAELSPLYPIHRSQDTFGAVALAGGAAAFGLLSALAWRARSRGLGFVLISFAVFFVPVSNVIPLYYQWQDRYLSLTLWPLALGVGALIAAIRDRFGPIAPALAIAALVTALGVRTNQYAAEWTSATRLFGHAANTHPRAFYAWINLGHARRDAGRLHGAIDAYSRASNVANLALAHDARFRAVLLLDEREQELEPSRADELGLRYHPAITQPQALRDLASELAPAGYRRAVMLLLDQSMVLDPIPSERLERAATIQLERGHVWLADFYMSRLGRDPVLPPLIERLRQRAEAEERAEAQDEPETAGEAPTPP